MTQRVFVLFEDDCETSTMLSLHETREGAVEAAHRYAEKDNKLVDEMNAGDPLEGTFSRWKESTDDPDILYSRYGWNHLYVYETDLEP